MDVQGITTTLALRVNIALTLSQRLVHLAISGFSRCSNVPIPVLYTQSMTSHYSSASSLREHKRRRAVRTGGRDVKSTEVRDTRTGATLSPSVALWRRVRNTDDSRLGYKRSRHRDEKIKAPFLRERWLKRGDFSYAT